MRASLLLIILLLVAGCRNDQVPPVLSDAAREAAEVDVVVCLLAQRYDYRLKDAAPLLVIRDTLSVEALRHGDKSQADFARSLQTDASDEVPADLISDFIAKTNKPQAVWPTLTARLPVVLLNTLEIKEVFSAGYGKKPDGWDNFYAKYPNSPGIITISRVGFNAGGGHGHGLPRLITSLA